MQAVDPPRRTYRAPKNRHLPVPHHALFVAFHFPPEASSSGVLRTLKYVRYLEDYGWRVTVISPKTDAYSIIDQRLEEQLPRSTRVVRTAWVNTKKRFAIFGAYPSLLALPDPWIGWLPWAVAAGRRVVQSDPAHVVYSTSPHATAHLIALVLARASKVPWIADFRDPWFEDPPEPGAPNGRLYMSINRLLEKSVTTRCTHIVTSTTHLRDSLRRRYSHLQREKITAIPNGYDEADFAAATSASRTERFTVVHAGSINADFRDPRPLFRALRRLIDNGQIERDRIELRFIGAGEYAASAALRTALAQTDLTKQVAFAPRIPFDETLRQLGAADLLLLLQASADTVDLVPAKLYEYLRAQRPVLAIVYPGATAEVLEVTGGGWAVDPRDDAAMDKAITVAYSAWKLDSLQRCAADLNALRQFDRRTLTGALAKLFDQLRSRESG
jgi:glycosyltransferase involved in cell wall biosynthesis